MKRLTRERLGEIAKTTVHDVAIIGELIDEIQVSWDDLARLKAENEKLEKMQW